MRRCLSAHPCGQRGDMIERTGETKIDFPQPAAVQQMTETVPVRSVYETEHFLRSF
jgi:hypothetical protein